MRDVSGVSGAGPIWHQIAEELIQRRWIQDTQIPPPPGIHQVTRCRDTPCYQKEFFPSKKTGTIPFYNPATGFPLADFIGIVTPEEEVQYHIKDFTKNIFPL